MKRYSDWERRLDAHLTAALETPFQWGVFDCALGACAAVAAMTGENPGAELVGQYETEEDAAALIALSAGLVLSLESPTPIESESAGDLGTLAAAIAEDHGFAEVRAGFARRGDVVLVNNTPTTSASDPSRALGTVDLSGRFAWCVGERGFVRVPMNRWLRAWRIA